MPLKLGLDVNTHTASVNQYGVRLDSGGLAPQLTSSSSLSVVVQRFLN